MNLSHRRALRPLFVCLLLSLLAAPLLHAQASINAIGVPVTEDFNALASTGTSAVVPTGWAFAESGTSAANNGLYTAGNGSGTGGDTYSFGSTGSSDRAFGGLLSGTLTPTIGASFVNNAGVAVGLLVAYTGEQWRLGTSGRGPDRLDFQYSLDATSLTTGTWIDVNSLDFSSPFTVGTVGALDGNAAANRTAISSSIPGLSLPAGATVWIRWSDFNPSGADDGLSIDDFSLTAVLSTSPSGVGAASPSLVTAGHTSLLTVAVTPGANPTDTVLTVTADLTSIGGSATQAFYDDQTHGDAVAGDLTFSYEATVGLLTSPGTKMLPVTITDTVPRTGSATIALDVLAPPSTTLVISQVYGGGGNTGATWKNDFIEIYNLGVTTVDVTGWSVQYASSTGTSWQVTPLPAGMIPPGRFYLVQESAGAGGTTVLPAPDAIGTIAMAAGSGKVALVSSTTALGGACPLPSAVVVDFVGYGGANCSETSPTPALSNTTAAIRNGNGSIDTDNNLADFAVAAPQPRNSSGQPPIGIGAADPASLSAGESTQLTVTVTPGAFPVAGGITVTGDLTAIGGSATQAFFDDGMTGGDMAAGDNVFSFLATVAAGTSAGSKVMPVVVADSVPRASNATITLIVEPAIVAIHDIQGSGNTSPLNGQLVATKGVVTGRKFNGFFIQAPDAEADADPSTSEGIFVFTNSTTAPGVGSYVKVAGTVQEFSPPQDPVQPPMTEISGTPSVTVLMTGQPTPTPYVLTAADTSSTSFDALERLEGMLVRVDSLRVIAPTQDLNVDEMNAESTSNGVFYGVVDGVPRPFREPGIAGLNALPAGAPANVPRFDENPERLRIDSDGQQGGAPLEVTSGALVSGIQGPLEISFRTWAIAPDPLAPPLLSGNISAVPVPEPSENEFTVGAFNLERFFNDVDDPGITEPVLTATAFANRLNKASLAIRNVMRTPDILGVVEVENLAALQALAAKIDADAMAAGDPLPGYAAYLEEGNDIGGIDVGFLVKAAPRVNVIDVTQVGKTATYVNPNTNGSELLNDRPPLVLRATVQGPIGAPYPVTVIVNHLRSLNDIDNETPSGSGTVGARVRAKRAAQAEFLADLIQTRQAAGERIASVGDYNAFAVNDGYVDLIGTIKGQPTPADQVVLASGDLVNPDLVSLVDLLPAAQAYSYSFDGSIQTLDHVLANASLMKRFSRFHYARNDADFPEDYRNDPTRPERLSDHDMPVAYFAFPGAPILTLNGSNPMTVECPGPFVDPGATASDTDLGDITSEIQVSGSVDAHTVGSYVLTYSVSNGFVTTTVTRTVDVVDTTPPVLTLNGPSPLSVELGGVYFEPGATASDTCAGDLTAAIQIAGAVNTGLVGSYPISYSVSDGYNTTLVVRLVHVVDSTPPAIASVSASPNVLWPPNKKLTPVVVSVSASDLSGPPYCRITEVTSDEPVSGKKAGKKSPDWIITGDLTLQLRKERLPHSDGRVYTIVVTCSDPSQNESTASTTVSVPHDKKHGRGHD